MAAVTLSGFNGIDFSQIINLTMQSESQPLTDLQTRKTNLQNEDTALLSMASILSAIKTPAAALTSSGFSDVSATSSDTSVATVSLGDGGIPGEYDLVIDHIAKAQVTSSTNGYAATTDVAATGGSISFTIGSETTDPINITADTSLSDLKQKINAQNSGVVASIVNDGTNYKLVISSRETGLTNGFTINNSLTNGSGSVVAFAVGQNATTGNTQNAINAAFTMNGLSIQSASNTVTDAVPGVTVSLVKPGSTNVNVSPDYGSVTSNLQTIVSQYNKLRQFYKQQNTGPLANDSVLREVMNDVKSVLLASNSNGGRYHYLAEVGIELTATGDLKLDQTKLNTAINTYPDDLQKLLQGTNGDGALNNLTNALKNLDETAGLIKTTRDSIDQSEKSLQNQIDAAQLRLDMRRQQLQTMYSQADQAMTQLNNLKSSLPTGSLF